GRLSIFSSGGSVTSILSPARTRSRGLAAGPFSLTNRGRIKRWSGARGSPLRWLARKRSRRSRATCFGATSLIVVDFSGAVFNGPSLYYGLADVAAQNLKHEPRFGARLIMSRRSD